MSARLCATTVLLAAVTLLAGCGALVAQNPGTAMRPVNAERSGDDARLMLERVSGRHPVAPARRVGYAEAAARYSH